jgi:hypothetical protein
MHPTRDPSNFQLLTLGCRFSGSLPSPLCFLGYALECYKAPATKRLISRYGIALPLPMAMRSNAKWLMPPVALVFLYCKPFDGNTNCCLCAKLTSKSVLFVATTVISALYTKKSRKDPTGQDPWLASEDKQPYAPASDMERGHTPSKDPIWDTNTRELDGMDEDGDSFEEQQHNRRPDEQEEYSRLHNTETDDGLHPGRPWGPLAGGNGARREMPSVDTEYRGAGTYQAPSALSPDGYHVDSPVRGMVSPVEDNSRRPPVGRYSFSGGNGH